jgi:hypothetical protein
MKLYFFIRPLRSFLPEVSSIYLKLDRMVDMLKEFRKFLPDTVLIDYKKEEKLIEDIRSSVASKNVYFF